MKLEGKTFVVLIEDLYEDQEILVSVLSPAGSGSQRDRGRA